jgi:hypothetical protein
VRALSGRTPCAPAPSAVAAADLVYTRNLLGAWRNARAGRRIAEHFRPWGDQYPPLQPFLALLRHLNMVGAVFHSELARQSYLRLGVPTERMLVAHNGWEPSRMEPPPHPGTGASASGLPPTDSRWSTLAA